MVGIIKFFGTLSIIVGALLILISFGIIILLPTLLPLGINALLGGALLIAFARAVQLLESIDDKIAPVRTTAGTATGQWSPDRRASFDESKWNALVEFDPDISAAVAKLQPLGRKYVDELAEKFLALNDKQQLDAIVRKIVERYQATPESERLDELGEKVEYIYSTPWGHIAGMKDGTVGCCRFG